MKKNLLFTFLIVSLFSFAANAQLGGNCSNCSDKYDETEQQVHVQKPAKKKKKITVYPNPAINYIGLSDSKDVQKIVIFNVMGKEAKSFIVEDGMKYDVAELKRGMYLVQIVGHKNEIITTQRLNKR